VRLTSTVDAYVALAGVPEDRRRTAWVEDYEAMYPTIFQTYHSGWGKHERCLSAVADVPHLAPDMAALEARARVVLEESEASFRADGLLDDELDVVLMVGSHSSNGWVTALEGTTTLFLALEFLGEAPFDAVLISHEALHVAQARRGAASWPHDCTSSLFQEGLAVAISRELHPGLPDSAYLWFDDAHTDWVQECRSHGAAIARRALDHLDTPDEDPEIRGLFTTRQDDQLPPRAGYWLGDLVVRRLRERHPSRELLTWEHATVRSALVGELTDRAER
jgi:hypothetical protein